jgi:protein-tyrosine phosphatase
MAAREYNLRNLSHEEFMDRFKFGPASADEPTVFGACRPGQNRDEIAEWIFFMKTNGIARVCCVIPSETLAAEPVDLLASYREAFGAENVLHAPVADFSLCDEGTMADHILPFLSEADERGGRAVVHCWAGMGRTGHVLAAWLARGRGMAPDKALTAVVAMGRNPFESIQYGGATEEDLYRLLRGKGGS